ncbi:MAG: hypothetical protein COA40_05770 [Aequorivita sp.]|nr:MAG: hypothetical protein COA40_05770 [Aequorivita sp.]
MNSLKMRLANFFTQFFFNKIIVCSDELKEWVVKTHKIKSSKLKVMYNCVDLSKFKPIQNKRLVIYLEISTTLPKYTFITVGSMGEGVNKRIDISIKAIKVLRDKGLDVGMVICGDGKNRNKLEQLSEDLDISNSILILGNRKDVHNIMPHCYAYIHSAPYEPFGIVCIEAMASGLPVIIPNSGGIQKIITDKKEGFIYQSLSEQALAAKVELLIASDYSKFATNALIKVQEYGVTPYVKTLYSLYE